MMCKCLPYKNLIGQIPGQTYDGRTVDQDGNGIFAGFIFLDNEGNAISQDFFTDAAGYFHFTVPEHNWQNIFVQLFATDEYEQPVKNFDQMVHEQPIVLRKKGSGDGIDILKLGALAVGVLTLFSGGNKVGEVAQRSNKTLPLLVGGGIAAWLILKYKPTPQQKAYLEAAKDRLRQLALDGIVASLSESQFTSMANQIRQAIANCGTDQDAIYRQFKMLNNEADLMMLIITYGIAKYDGCFEGSLPSWNVHYTLSESISSDMTNSEVRSINNILSAKRINFSF